MNRLKNKFLSVVLSAAMVAGMLSPMGVQAATWSKDTSPSGYEKIANLTATAPSATDQESADVGYGKVEAAVDDNSGTFWHSAYDNSQYDLRQGGGTVASPYSYIEVALPEVLGVL